MRILLSLIVLLVLFPGLAAADSVGTHAPDYADGEVIGSDTRWRGRVVVDGVILVREGVTLTVEPGTVVMFTKSDASFTETGAAEALIPGSGIRVEGTLIAKGTRQAPITFTSAEKAPAPGDWGCVFFDHSKDNVFEYCVFEYSSYTVHAHFSRLTFNRCLITKNIDGSRLGYSRADYTRCDIKANTGKGLNFFQCKNTVTLCNITGNHEGIFFNAEDSACVVEKNNIHGNEGVALRLGEFHEEDVSLSGNWWGTADIAAIREYVYDNEDDPEIGRATIEPAMRMIEGAGVGGVEIKVNWKFPTGGFVDSSPAVDGGRVYFGSWDRHLYCLDAATGGLVWKFETGDCVDSSPAVHDGRVYFGSWDRNVYCLDAADGKLLWKYEMEPSNLDDHRQSSPVVCEKVVYTPLVVYMGGFNGLLYSLDAKLSKMWEFPTKGPIRCRPAVFHSIWGEDGVVLGDLRIIFFGSGDGNLYAVDLNNGGTIHRERWSFKTGGAVNSSPAINEKHVYFGSRDGFLYCLNIADGKEVWRSRTGDKIEYSSPLIAEDKVFIGACDGKLHAVSADDGSPQWAFDCGAVIYSSPLMASGRLVFGDNDGRVHFLDTKNGSPNGVFEAGDAVQALSTGPDDVVYAGSRDGFLYSISASY